MNTTNSSIKKQNYNKFGQQKNDLRSSVQQVSDINELKRVLQQIISQYKNVLNEIELELFQQENQNDEQLYMVRKFQILTKAAGIEYEELLDALVNQSAQNNLHKLLNEVIDYYELEQAALQQFDKQNLVCQQMQQQGLKMEETNKNLEMQITSLIKQHREQEEETKNIIIKKEQIHIENQKKENEFNKQQQQIISDKNINKCLSQEIDSFQQQIEGIKKNIEIKTDLIVDPNTNIREQITDSQRHLNTKQEEFNKENIQFKADLDEIQQEDNQIKVLEEILQKQQKKIQNQEIQQQNEQSLAQLDQQIRDVKVKINLIPQIKDSIIENEQNQVKLLSEKNEIEEQEIENQSNIQSQQLLGFKLKQVEIEKLKLDQEKETNKDYRQSIRQQVQDIMCVLEKHSEKQQELDKKEEEFQKEMSILERMLVDSML